MEERDAGKISMREKLGRARARARAICWRPEERVDIGGVLEHP